MCYSLLIDLDKIVFVLIQNKWSEENRLQQTQSFAQTMLGYVVLNKEIRLL